MPRSRELLYRRHAGDAAGKSGGPQGQAVALPAFLPVSSTMTGTIACGYVEGGVRVGMVDRGGAIA
jgi:hypothetical protein